MTLAVALGVKEHRLLFVTNIRYFQVRNIYQISGSFCACEIIQLVYVVPYLVTGVQKTTKKTNKWRPESERSESDRDSCFRPHIYVCPNRRREW